MYSLNEAISYEVSNTDITKLYNVQLTDEPRSIAVSRAFFVCNFGSKIQIYHTGQLTHNEQQETKSIIRDFSSNITHICLNDEYMAILSEGRLHFQRVDGDMPERIFPLKDTDDIIIYAAMTNHFLYYSDSNNRIKTFQITQSNSVCVAEYKFENPIRKIFPNSLGTKVLCIDNLGKGLYYSPINESVTSLNNDSEFISIIWDSEDPNTFVTVTKSNLIFVYYISDNSTRGEQVEILKELTCIEDLDAEKLQISSQKLEVNSFPFYLSNGLLYFYQRSTKDIKVSPLLSHYWIFNWRDKGDSEDGHKKYFMQNFQLRRYSNCFKAAEYLKDKKIYYETLGREALKNLDIDSAEESFRRAGNISLILTVEKLREENERKVLLGHIAAILGDESTAQDYFKSSSRPSLAVDLRCDLQDWQIALKLAKEYQPYREVFISKKLAYHYETMNNSSDAIKMYEKSKIGNILAFQTRLENDITNTSHRNTDSKDLDEHNIQCEAGIARCSFRLGDTTRGMDIANNLTSKKLVLEIASLAESLNYSIEAAKLYEKIGSYERAAATYINIKQFKSAEALIDKIKSNSLLIQLARMKEAEKMYKDAENAYERASEWENVIRLNLKFLNNPDKAKEICLTKHKTESAALMIAEYFETVGRKKETIEFNLIAKRYTEAFAIAQSFNEMDIYAEFIAKHVKNTEEFKKIAIYYEGKNQYGKSGIYYEKSGNTHKALKMYIKSNDDEYLEKAVIMVGINKEETLTNELIDHLLVSQIESGPHFLIKLYIFLGNYAKACEIGIDLSQQEQELSNYKIAHNVLLDLYRLLKEKNLPVSYECNHRLSVLHSYLLAKRFIKLKLNMNAARNLLRVANNIQMFEKHTVEVLTTLCIQCNEAKLVKSASEWAITLWDKIDYRNRIHEHYRNTIENLSRKSYLNTDEPKQMNSPCPYCNTDIPEYSLTCSNCYNVIPFCIASGKHMIANDLYQCPNCLFPAIGNEFKKILSLSSNCPMCEKEIDIQLLYPSTDPIGFIKSRKVAKLEDKNFEINKKE